MSEPIYNRIGKTYDTTRKADTVITQTIMKYLRADPNKKYLDIACGSGNYTAALDSQKINVEGIDISSEMLRKAKMKYPHIQWYEGDARQLPFDSDCYDGAICILATHHIKDITSAFQEAFRVIHKGRLVIFTATPAQCHQYWLQEYFPKMIESAGKTMTSFEDMACVLSEAGFKNVNSKPYFVTHDLEDLFLYAGKYRPEMYLNSDIRKGISSFQLSSYKDEIDHGLIRLERDISSGKIQEIIKAHESSIGDYLFVVAEK